VYKYLLQYIYIFTVYFFEYIQTLTVYHRFFLIHLGDELLFLIIYLFVYITLTYLFDGTFTVTYCRIK